MKYTDLKIKKSKKKAGLTWKSYLIIVGTALTSIFILNKARSGMDMNPISIVSNVAAANVKETDGRTNILILGSDKRNYDANYTGGLTDTILVASIGHVDNDVVLISIPRDLWVQNSQGYHTKINEVYFNETYNYKALHREEYKFGKSTEIQSIMEKVLGIPIHYYALVNFDLFKDAIDLLGGITVDVEKTFTDTNYPVPGKENGTDSERYETVHFEAGTQLMDGETALKYVRSRKGNNDEGTDFARSKRQQKAIMAIKNKALALETLIDIQKVKDLYELYSKNVDTDMDLSTLQNFYLISRKISFDKVVSIVLDDRSEANVGGLLFAPEDRSLYGGAYVLLPKTGDYSQIHAYVQKYIFGDK